MNLRRDPLAFPGMRIGLYGGSFDPAHSGHAHVAATALHALGLDQVWWLVTPQNPLKPKSGSLQARMGSARAVARGGRQVVTDIETRLGTQYSADTVSALQARYPGVRFVWIMGGDNLSGFHRWRRWRDIFHALPIAIVSRERIAARGLKAPAFAQFARARRPAAEAAILPTAATPAWLYLPARLDPASSTALRREPGRPPGASDSGATVLGSGSKGQKKG